MSSLLSELSFTEYNLFSLARFLNCTKIREKTALKIFPILFDEFFDFEILNQIFIFFSSKRYVKVYQNKNRCNLTEKN